MAVFELFTFLGTSLKVEYIFEFGTLIELRHALNFIKILMMDPHLEVKNFLECRGKQARIQGVQVHPKDESRVQRTPEINQGCSAPFPQALL